MSNLKTYKLNYLLNVEYTDDDLHNLLDSNSLTYSLIVEMYKFAGYKLNKNEILDIITINNNWVYTTFWSEQKRDEYTDIVKNVYKKLYQYSDERSLSMAQWWMTYYGFTVR